MTPNYTEENACLETPMDPQSYYTVSLPEPSNHLFQVRWQLPQVSGPIWVKMPVWTPGSYLVREYSRHVQQLQAEGDAQLEPINKNTWRVTAPHYPYDLTLTYEVYAYELTVRTNDLTPEHGYFNGAALFLYAPERRWQPCSLTVIPPDPTWEVATALPQVGPGTYLADNYDHLIDCPVEIGIHKRLDFRVLDCPHSWVIWGDGDLDPQQLQIDTEKIILTTANLFGGLPYSYYLFLLHLVPDGFGGLEHRTSTSLIFKGFGHGDPEQYRRLLALVAHEFFHTWNVKRLRPQALESVDLDQENYLTSLWFVEGATSYMENWILNRAGLLSPPQWLALLGQQISRLQATPGRHRQSLSTSSWETWIKLYRPHENSHNSQVSYYLKGALVCWLLDLTIITRSQGQASLATVFQDLWQRFGIPERGYSEADLRAACERAARGSLGDFFRDYVDGTVELDYNQTLEPFGLQVVAFSGTDPYLGLHLKPGSLEIARVDQGSPAQQAGIWAGDELLAWNGYRLTAATWQDWLKGAEPGATIHLSLFQRQKLRTLPVRLAAPQLERYEIQPLPFPSQGQASLYRCWMQI